ncbi:MAG: hypothetical protein ACHQ9S_23115 [Candidatus Binatia bacterium]
MYESLTPRWRGVVSSLTYTALVATAAALGYLTFRATQHPNGAENVEAAAESAVAPLIELSGFSARKEKSSDAERLNVAVRVRLTTRAAIDCYIYIIAHNEHVSPKLWVVWPMQAIGAVTAGGHFRGSTPPSGEAIKLSSGWARLNATLQHPVGQAPFDTVTVYVVGAKGEILVERPFPL